MNFTRTFPVLTAAPTASATGCCYIWPQFVGLGQWYTRSVTATVATVITQYIQYNNTVVTTSTTYFNETATRTDALGLGNILSGPGFAVYDNTQVVLGTSTNEACMAL
jgi:hypothetical protein